MVPPIRPPHPSFWWALLWCLGFFVVTQILPGILGLFIFLISSAGRLTPEQLADPQALVNSPAFVQAILVSVLASQLLSVASGLLAIRLIVGKQWPRILALRCPSWSHLVLALLGLPGLIVIATGIDALARRVLPSIMDLEQTMALIGKWPWPVGVLVIGLGPGIGEELWFRGFLGRGLVSRHGFVGILLTSLLFGLIHLEPRQVAYAIVIGFLLHLSYLATRSLLVPILVHTVNNSLSVLAMHSPTLQAIDIPAAQVSWYVYAAAILLLTAVGWAFWKTRPLLVDRLATEGLPWRPAFTGVEYPPPGTRTKVLHRAPDKWIWLLVLASLAAFAAAIVPLSMEASK
jgi:membrane protease YdiL (CAAX protease family)